MVSWQEKPQRPRVYRDGRRVNQDNLLGLLLIGILLLAAVLDGQLR